MWIISSNIYGSCAFCFLRNVHSVYPTIYDNILGVIPLSDAWLAKACLPSCRFPLCSRDFFPLAVQRFLIPFFSSWSYFLWCQSTLQKAPPCACTHPACSCTCPACSCTHLSYSCTCPACSCTCLYLHLPAPAPACACTCLCLLLHLPVPASWTDISLLFFSGVRVSDIFVRYSFLFNF